MPRPARRFGYDDSLDVVGVHLVGGATGALLIGLLAAPFIPGTGGVAGTFYGGGFDQLWRQAVAVVAVGLYSFVLAWIIGFAIQKTIGFRITSEAEVDGIDNAEHAESAYDFAPTTGTGGAFALAGVGATKPSSTDGADNVPVTEKVTG